MERGILIYLMRHGDTGLSGRYVGTSDVPVSEAGLLQLSQMKNGFAALSPDRIYVSPMLRCRQSLAAIGFTGRETVVEDLAEIDFGRWEGKSFAEVVQEDPVLAGKWGNDPDFIFPEGESLAHFRMRLKRFTAMLATERGPVFLLTHGGVIRHLICLLLRIPEEQYLLFDVQPGLLTEIHLYSQGGILRRLNARV